MNDAVAALHVRFEGNPLRRLLLRVKGGLASEFVFVLHGAPPVVKFRVPQAAMCPPTATRRLELLIQLKLIPSRQAVRLAGHPDHSHQLPEHRVCRAALPDGDISGGTPPRLCVYCFHHN